MSKTQNLWECKLDGCNETFTRYPYQIKKGTHLYCGQSHASKDVYEKSKKRRIKPIYNCIWCNIKTPNHSKHCTECKRIRDRAKQNGIVDFTPLDYYNFLEKQNNLCAICKQMFYWTKFLH